MKSVILASVFSALALLVSGCKERSAPEMVLNGGGASFPAPVYQSWTHSYSEVTPGIKVNYQSLGSGAGVNQLKENTVDFAGTDNPLTAEQQKEAGFEQFPMLTGGVVVIYNLPNIAGKRLKLSRKALSEIYLGRITRWNDPQLLADNPALGLPDLEITVVRRADSSGTSFLFTDYLSKCSPAWKEQVGAGSAVKWPVGLGGQKNPGVCNNVAKIVGAIGYTEYTYATEAGLAMAELENRAGKYVEPSPKSFAASSALADWQDAPGFYMLLTDAAGDEAWPITGVTYILLRKDCPPERRKELVKYFRWCFKDGAVAAHRLNYVPLPENVYKMVFSEVLK